MSRRSAAAGTAAVAAAAALAVAGCGSSHATASSASAGTIGGSAISRAANISGAAKGEKVAYSITETEPSVGKLTVSGTGAFNNSPEEGSMTLHLSVPNASGLGSQAASILSNLNLQMVFEKGTVYLKIPSSLASKASAYTGGKPWVSVNLSSFASSSGVPGASNLLNGSTSPANPTAELKQLEAASSSGVTKVGSATVNGVATTEYKLTLNLNKLSNRLPAAQQKAMKRLLAQSAKQMGTTSLPVTLYIDSANLIRRLSISFTQNVSGQSVPVSIREDFLAYGPQPAPSVPPAGQVDNLTSLLSRYGSQAGFGG